MKNNQKIKKRKSQLQQLHPAEIINSQICNIKFYIELKIDS